MKEYFLMILGAAVLSALASIMSPEKWRSYIRLVTGVVILSCAASPIAGLLSPGGFNIPEPAAPREYDENAYAEAVEAELRNRIEQDIEARMKREYDVDVEASVIININERNEIEGVERITVRGSLTERAKRELCEIYGVGRVYEK